MPMNESELSEEIKKRTGILSEAARLLDAKDVSFASITSKIDALSDEELLLRLSLNRLAFIEDELTMNLARLSHELQLISKWRVILGSELVSSETSASLERKREALIRKAKELNREFITAMDESKDKSSTTITHVLKQKERNAKKEEALKIKRAKLRVLQGLPPNLELARHELFQAEQEQVKLIQLRERLLGSLANDIS
ncbi:hypothetical protein D9756_004355 [Leucocoprinus leucothites]|uniref:Uncharacterized protein n=1 Tax=Leucocoprinus leucothites TaxID=201217 RepID=A0A8H5DAW3_9AGAR|nr:hypothetical protein D9756_004355 [Leucoagaricus leucothites]